MARRPRNYGTSFTETLSYTPTDPETGDEMDEIEVNVFGTVYVEADSRDCPGSCDVSIEGAETMDGKPFPVEDLDEADIIARVSENAGDHYDDAHYRPED
jgi:hypothetical protein